MRTSVVFVVLLGVVRTVHGACDRPTGRPNTELITDVTFPAPDGTSVTFTCEVGYRRVGSGTVACSAGTWSNLNMKCEIINCGSAGEVINGHVNYSKGTEFGVSAHVVCNDGYRVVGFENNLHCGVNGWQGRLASCEVIMCDAPNQIANGYFSPMKDEYEHSEVITYSCKGEHTLNGSKTATCEENGQFHPAPPTCVLIECRAPEIINGVVVNGARSTYKFKETITLRCRMGYKLSGRSTLTCEAKDQWSAALPVCTLVECMSPEVTDGQVVEEEEARPSYKYEDVVVVKCKSGYSMSGQSEQTCGLNSQWSPGLPQCTHWFQKVKNWLNWN